MEGRNVIALMVNIYLLTAAIIWFIVNLKEKFAFLRIKPIYDALQHYYDEVGELELIADVTAGLKCLKTTEEHVHWDNPSKNTINACFKGLETHWMFSGVLSCTDTKTWSYTWLYNPKTAVCFFPKAAERAVFGLYIGV